MREIVLDTETTGLKPEEGHRIVEIGAVELWHQVPTGKTYHQYINPERPMPAEAYAVHGIGDEMLADKPVFAQIVQAFRDFIGDSHLIIHNADFDMAFLNAELEWAGHPTLPGAQAIDTLGIARRKFPGSPVSLDALCRRFSIDYSMREKHGALIDAKILAGVYLELIGGKQPDFALDQGSDRGSVTLETSAWRPMARPNPLPQRLSEAERAAHAAFVEDIGPDAIWARYIALDET
jgi:DNA polymerase-3 subunit epsilon